MFLGYPRLRMACRQNARSCPAENIRSQREVPNLLNSPVEENRGEHGPPRRELYDAGGLT